jgi:hypothetical protein
MIAIAGNVYDAVAIANGWSIPNVTTVIFIVIGLVVIIDLWIENTKLIDKRPAITVTEDIQNALATLVVTNDGGGADFTASAKVVRGFSTFSGLYAMCWDSVVEAKCHINGKGGMASILVAGIADHTIGHNSNKTLSTIFKGDLVLYRQDATGRKEFTAHLSDPVTYRDGSSIIELGWAKNECVLEVTITADPPLKVPFQQRIYKLATYDNIFELSSMDSIIPQSPLTTKCGRLSLMPLRAFSDKD